MEPLSIISGTLSICDICLRVCQYLKNVREASGSIEGEIEGLERELRGLQDVNKAIEAICAANQGNGISHSIAISSSGGDKITWSLWKDVNGIRQSCKVAVEDLEKILVEKFDPLIKGIIGTGPSKVTGAWDGLRKQIRKQAKKEDLREFRLLLANYQGRLQVLLTALNISYTCNINSSTTRLTEYIQRLGYDLQSQIKSLRQGAKDTPSISLGDAPRSATTIASLLSFNKHFDTPRPVSSIFTGRSAVLQHLGDSVFSAESCTTQRRFIVHGYGGCGKTEICCKFAQDYQQLFWGVFWIDAASIATVQSTFSRIAKLGGVEPNTEAAKSWLSSLDQPWLLIIEYANGDNTVHLTNLFPEGRRGIILVTTRNSSDRTHGTIGKRWLQCEKMDTDEANELLLKASSIETRDLATRSHASRVSETLGFLPLALVHAGKAILDRLCTLSEYVAYFWRFLDRVRNNSFDDDESNMRVYSTFEILFVGLEGKRDQRLKGFLVAGDAIELLKVFSFLSCEKIELSMLTKAVENSRIERDARANEQPQEKQTVMTRDGLLKVIKLLRNYNILKETPPVLPAVLREYDVDRLRKALTLLTQLALITYHDASEQYSMHPLVHIWSRYRPEMKLGEQAVWCHAAATTIAQCVLLPPLGGSESEARLLVQLIPHVKHVLVCKEKINFSFEERRQKRNRPWPPLSMHRFDRGDARMYAKFSMVYAHGGMWKDAEMLQRLVMNFVHGVLGTNNSTAIDIGLALSGSLMNQSRANEAAELQKQALETSTHLLGHEDTKTVKIMSMLATSYVYGGRFQAALQLYEDCIEKLTRITGSNDAETLRAVDAKGRLMMRYQRHVDAENLHRRAATGLEEVLGKEHPDTLTAKSSLAMAKLQLRGENLSDAIELIEDVYEERKKQLGKEHPLTLLAICDFARIKAAMDWTEEAEKMMLDALVIAKRNLGDDHQGVLMGRAHLANLYVQVKRFDEAESILLDVIKPERYAASVRADGEHPDRIAALWYLMSCYLAQDKNQEAYDITVQLYQAIENCGGEGLGKNHVMATKVLDKRKELEIIFDSAGLGTTE